MNAIWTFERGHLVARNLAGDELGAWVATEAIGHPLADLLNLAHELSPMLLPPWAGTHRVDG